MKRVLVGLLAGVALLLTGCVPPPAAPAPPSSSTTTSSSSTTTSTTTSSTSTMSTTVAPTTTSSSTTTSTSTTSTTVPPATTSTTRPPSGKLPYGLSGNPADYGPKSGLPARTAYTGPRTITTNGAVVQNVNIVGSLDVAASNVTFRNVRFTNGGSYLYWFLILHGSGYTIEDVWFDGAGGDGRPAVTDAILFGSGVTINRVDMTKVENGIESGNFTFTNSYLHDLWQNDPNAPDPAHADGMQSDQGAGITVANNYIAMGRPPAGYWSQTSAVGMWADINSSSVVRDALVTHNVVEPMGGFLFYDGVTNNTGGQVINVHFDENVVRRAGKREGDYGVFYKNPGNPPYGAHQGNVYDDGTSAEGD